MRSLERLWIARFLYGLALTLAACGKADGDVRGLPPANISSYSDCVNDSVTTGPCVVKSSGVIVSSNFGNDVTNWSNDAGSTTVTSSIQNGFYANQDVRFTDMNLTPANIAAGISIFGVIGTASAAPAACADNTLNGSACTAVASRYVTATAGANVSGSDGLLTATIPSGFQDGTRTCSMSDTNLTANNLRSGATVFGVTGSYTGTFALNMASNAHRQAGAAVVPFLAPQATSSQLSLASEGTTYAGQALPNTDGYLYRDIPDTTNDDEGYEGITCQYAPRPATDCGTSQASIDLRIEDCAAANPTTSTWNGAIQCNGGQGEWKLVARKGANKEVWQDRRTKLLWSSLVHTAINWCRASGNTQLAPVAISRAYNNAPGTPLVGNGVIGSIQSGSSAPAETITITFTGATTFTVTGTSGASGCQGGAITAGGLTGAAGSTVTWSRSNICSFVFVQGSTPFAANDKFILQSSGPSYSCAPGGSLQTASPVSYCAEAAGLSPGTGDDWSTPVYMAAKGGLGKNSVPSVRWRIPTLNDYKLADVNGIRMVLPENMGAPGANRPVIDGSSGSVGYEWTATLLSIDRDDAWTYDGARGRTTNSARFLNFRTRCVGR